MHIMPLEARARGAPFVFPQTHVLTLSWIDRFTLLWIDLHPLALSWIDRFTPSHG